MWSEISTLFSRLFWISQFEFAGRTVKHWRTVLTGSLAIALLDRGLEKANLHLAWKWDLVGLGVIVLFAMMRAFHDVRSERDEHAKRLGARLAVIDDDPRCLDRGRSPSLGDYQNCKILIKNLSKGTALNNVHVELLRFHETEGVPDWLRSRTAPLKPEYGDGLDRWWEKTIPPGDELFVGVFGVDTARPECFRLYHLAPGFPDRLEFGVYLADVQITGDFPAVMRVVRIGKDASGTPFLKIMSSPLSG